MFFTIILIFNSCNKIINKSIIKELTIDELSKEIKSNEKFAEFYSELREAVDDLSDIEKAKFYDITYRRLFNYTVYENDTAYWRPIYEKYSDEWHKNDSINMLKADLEINKWKDKIEKENLHQYVEFSFDSISWSKPNFRGDIDAFFVFTITPLKGDLEEVCFNFGFKPKEGNYRKHTKRHQCNYTGGYSSPKKVIRFVNEDDRNKVRGITMQELLEYCDLHLKITHVKKDGETIGIHTDSIPEDIYECIVSEDYGTYDYRRNKIKVFERITGDKYIYDMAYIIEKLSEKKIKKDELCYHFYKENFTYYW
ncbi:MAG: hypothetical protein GX921_07715 [Bacteroidales bacterium]|nr:hypothetical protein [Bacteroidales bacterium]